MLRPCTTSFSSLRINEAMENSSFTGVFAGDTTTTNSAEGSTEDQTTAATTAYWTEVTTPSYSNTITGFPEVASDLLFVVVSVFSVLGAVGNIITLTALGRSPKLRWKATTAFVLNLALADCVFSAATGPFDAAVFYHRSWPYGRHLCVAVALLRHLTVGASLFSIQIITVNRYVSVLKPCWYRTLFGEGSCLLLVALSWVGPALLLLPATLKVWGRFGYDSQDASCTIARVTGSSAFYKPCLYLTSACIPIITCLVCYPPLFMVLRRSQRRLTSHCVSAMRLECILPPSSSEATYTFATGNTDRTASLLTLNVHHSGRKTSTLRRPVLARERQLLLVIVAIFGAFLLCYVPLLVVAGLDLAAEYPWLRLWTYITFYASPCANPLIYAVMSREYRKAYLDLFVTRTRRDSDSETGTVNAL